MYPATAKAATVLRPDAHHTEDHEQQPQRGDRLGEPEVPARPFGGRPLHRGQVEHQVGDDGTQDRPADLGDDIPDCGRRVDAAERTVDERHDRIEVRAGRRAQRQDQCHEHARGRHGVLQELQAPVVGQALRHDPRADDTGDQERRPGELGGEPPHDRRDRLRGEPARARLAGASSRRERGPPRQGVRGGHVWSGRSRLCDQRTDTRLDLVADGARTTSMGWPAGSVSSQSS